MLAVLIVGTTAYGAFNAWTVYQAGSQIFVNGGSDSRAASATPTTTGDGASGAPTPFGSDPGIVDATPLTTPAPGSDRITVLLTGVDSSPTRDHALNDTMIVVSLNTTTGKLAMVSFARDIAGFKMWDGSTYAGKLNSLMSAAQSDPKDCPLGGINTLVKELSFLIGIPIDYYAAVNLPGFVSLVDAAGGVTVTNDAVIADPHYGGWTSPSHPIGFNLGVGTFTLNGEDALAFARSRYGPGGNDFVRARRQQALSLSLEKKLTSPSMLSRLPAIIKALGNTVRTNYPADQLSQVLTAAKTVNADNTFRVVLGPPYAVRSTDPTTSSLTLDMARIKALSISLFGAESAYSPAPTPGASDSPSPSTGPQRPGPAWPTRPANAATQDRNRRSPGECRRAPAALAKVRTALPRSSRPPVKSTGLPVIRWRGCGRTRPGRPATPSRHQTSTTRCPSRRWRPAGW